MEALRAVEPAVDVEAANRDLEGASAEQIVAWTSEQFGDRVILSSSFGAHSAVMLHLVSRIAPNARVVLIDTGYLFPETYRFAEEMTKRLELDLVVYGPSITPARQEALYGRLWEAGPEGVERYLWINKVEPMQRALRELGALAWMAGVRRSQTEHRSSLRTVDVQDGRFKVHPILGWSDADLDAYLTEHQLPHHPLYHEGYRSLGDWHSTLPTAPDQDPRDGRVLGKKRECGIHLPLTPEQNASLKSSGL